MFPVMSTIESLTRTQPTKMSHKVLWVMLCAEFRMKPPRRFCSEGFSGVLKSQSDTEVNSEGYLSQRMQIGGTQEIISWLFQPYWCCRYHLLEIAVQMSKTATIYYIKLITKTTTIEFITLHITFDPLPPKKESVLRLHQTCLARTHFAT